MTASIVVLYEEHAELDFLRELLMAHAQENDFLSGEILREERGQVHLLQSRWLGKAPAVHPKARGWRFEVVDALL